MNIIVSYSIVSLLLISCGWISILGRWVRFFYFGIGVGLNTIAIEKFEPKWLIFLCITVSLLVAFFFFRSANNNKEGSLVIPERVTRNMFEYITGSFVGIIWGCFEFF